MKAIRMTLRAISGASRSWLASCVTESIVSIFTRYCLDQYINIGILIYLGRMPTLPPHEKTAEWIHIRIHKNPKNPEYNTFFERQFDSVISCYETHSNRPHVHVLCKIKVTRSVQIRKLLKKMFNFDGNTDFSVTNVAPTPNDIKEMSQYVCKGNDKKTLPEVVFKTVDWTKEFIEQKHTDYWAVSRIDKHVEEQQHVTVNLNDFPIKEKVVRRTWTEKIVDELISEYEDTAWDWHNKKHKEFMLEYVLRKLGEKRKIFNEYKIKEFVYACFNALDAKHFRDDITEKVMGML